jgi:hypothetical protein
VAPNAILNMGMVNDFAWGARVRADADLKFTTAPDGDSSVILRRMNAANQGYVLDLFEKDGGMHVRATVRGLPMDCEVVDTMPLMTNEWTRIKAFYKKNGNPDLVLTVEGHPLIPGVDCGNSDIVVPTDAPIEIGHSIVLNTNFLGDLDDLFLRKKDVEIACADTDLKVRYSLEPNGLPDNDCSTGLPISLMGGLTVECEQ